MANIFKPPCDEGVLISGDAVSPCTKAAGPWILTATILGSSMAFIDGTVVNVALPALQTSLRATAAQVQWVVESYALFLASLLLVGGSLGDRYGRKKVYALGIAIFALASASCGVSRTVNQLIVARGFQGIGAALLVPGSLAIISASFKEEERGKAIGTWSGFTSITAAIGPVLGGWMIEHVSWRAVFYLNLPLAGIVLLLLFWRVPESRDTKRHAGLDWAGTIAATLGLGSLVYGLIESSTRGFDHPAVLITLITGVVSLFVFVILEARHPSPVLPLKLFRSKNFTGANLLTLSLYAALGGALFFFPLNLIQIQGYSATAAGAAFLPFILIMFVMSRWSGGLIKQFGAKIPLMIGPAIAAGGFVLFAVPEVSDNYWLSFFPAVLVLGFGMAISVAPLTTTVMNSVPESQSGIASGINNAISRTAALLALAVFGVVMLQSFGKNLDRRLEALPISEKEERLIQDQKFKLAGIDVSAVSDTSTRDVLRRAVIQSFVSSFRIIMVIAAALAGTSSVFAWLLVEGRSLVRHAPG